MIDKKAYRELRNIKDEPCVAIYMPMEITGDYQKNRIKWKNACNKAKDELIAQGTEKTSFLQPAFDLIDDMEFWAHQSAGLVGFYSANVNSYFHLNRACPDKVSVRDHFFMVPLLKELIHDQRIFILSVSQNETRFFEAVPTGIYPVIIHDKIPLDMEAALRLDIDGQSIQSHNAGSNTTYHGNDSGDDKENVRLEQYMRAIDKGLMDVIHDEKVPLVLASVKEYHPIYKSVTEYKYLSDEMIEGNPEQLSPSELRDKVQHMFDNARDQKLERFNSQYHQSLKDNKATDVVEKICDRGVSGNIQTVRLNENIFDNGIFEKYDQLEEALLTTYEQGGEIVFENYDPEDENIVPIKALVNF